MKWVKIFNSLNEAKERMANKTPIKITVGNKVLCGVRINDNLHVSTNKCPHSGAALNEGRVNHLNEIICPLHSYRFNLLDGREANSQCADLEIFPVRIKEDGVYLAL
ncbi:Rieske (2Fe-2S) protein [Fulvivirga lutea]|uniref:Rieske 2Fe-2S domain-containing protein n=1 Tax=Fulvivirga lutea TaxID=2810512 RepID=A0A974WJ24_9BACT|nr:Rieske 2Fe-2S domain-containing protein [Fulvivirga lutea]QSE98122.1 Rieske 2Fe-2S domain-containing protein [Fulvivirga lutea]